MNRGLAPLLAVPLCPAGGYNTAGAHRLGISYQSIM